jgi:hypothetical protein
LEKLDEIGSELVFAYLVFWEVEFLHEVDEGRKLETFWLELEFLFEDLYVLLGEHKHDALHVLSIRSLFFEDMRVEVEVFDQFCQSSEAYFD